MKLIYAQGLVRTAAEWQFAPHTHTQKAVEN